MKGSGCHLIYTKVPEAFFIQLKISLLFALLATLPLCVVHILLFLLPGFYKYEAKTVSALIIGGFFMFLSGSVFAYSVILPVAWDFFMLMGSNGDSMLNISLETRIEDYVSLFFSVVFSIGISFELPVVVVGCYVLGLVDREDLIKYRRYAVLLSLVGAAILSPPDILSQLFIGVPLILCYEFIILASFLFEISKD